ncbi:MAG: VanW family protein, partial [Candidatus Gracilibacteria bacterium]
IIQRTLLKEAIELAIENKIRNVTIPIVTIAPKITPDTEALKMGIKDRLSVGHTSFYGSPANRVHNIKTGTDKFNGTLIAPGEIFSFNKTLGSVTAANGYKMELVIKPEGTIPEFGGGLCQVSTTTFRAALFAGLSIEERHQHTYAVTYYSQILGHGLDATIYEGGADLKFKNNTNGYILIQSYVDKDYELYFVLYGTEDGRQVTMEGPYISNSRGAGPTEYIETTELKKGESKQKERAHAGFDALWYRYLTMPNGDATKEEIFSRYKAVPAKVLTGTAE